MKFWMTGIFASALTGFVWVGLWHLVLTMTMILATGAALPLVPGPAAFSGIVAGAFAALQTTGVTTQPTDNWDYFDRLPAVQFIIWRAVRSKWSFGPVATFAAASTGIGGWVVEH